MTSGLRASAAPGGFTLIELMVVLLIVTLLLGGLAPLGTGAVPGEDERRLVRWLEQVPVELRRRALAEHRTYTLEIGIARQRLWFTHAAMTPDERREAAAAGLTAPDGLRLREVVTGDGDRQAAGTVHLNFYPDGSADRALLHLGDRDATRRSLRIEERLPAPKWLPAKKGA